MSAPQKIGKAQPQPVRIKSMTTLVQRVLIPIDFSNAARSAFNYGVNLATKFGADTFILHVSEPIRSFDLNKKKYIETQDAIERVEEGVQRRIDELWNEGGIDAVDRRKIHLIVRGGRAAHEILETAEARNVDLIVMGTSEANEVGGVGGTAERVIRAAKCSVLCVKNS